MNVAVDAYAFKRPWHCKTSELVKQISYADVPATHSLQLAEHHLCASFLRKKCWWQCLYKQTVYSYLLRLCHYSVTSVHLPTAYLHASTEDGSGHLFDTHVPCCKDVAMQCNALTAPVQNWIHIHAALWYYIRISHSCRRFLSYTALVHHDVQICLRPQMEGP